MNDKIWTPKNIESTRMWQFMDFVAKQHKLSLTSYQELHEWSVTYPPLFWQALCDYFKLHFDTPATEILNHYDHMIEARWFTGATFNFAQKTTFSSRSTACIS